MVTIYDLLDRKVYDFPFNCWLSGKDGDHKTYQTLFPDQQRVLGDGLIVFIECYYLSDTNSDHLSDLSLK